VGEHRTMGLKEPLLPEASAPALDHDGGVNVAVNVDSSARPPPFNPDLYEDAVPTAQTRLEPGRAPRYGTNEHAAIRMHTSGAFRMTRACPDHTALFLLVSQPCASQGARRSARASNNSPYLPRSRQCCAFVPADHREVLFCNVGRPCSLCLPGRGSLPSLAC